MAASLTRGDFDHTAVGDDGDDDLPSTVYRLYPHTRLLSAKFRAAAYGKTRRDRRQIWALPPRYGKSILASQWGPAWYLEMFPYKRIILASYGHDLALHNARQTRNIIRGYSHRLSVQLQRDDAAADQWSTVEKGGMKAAGVGGALTGFGADLAVIDDPFKDWEEAQSQNQREKVWDWYRAVLRTRLHKGGSIILLATRWHLDDLSGRLLAEDRERVANGMEPMWDYVRMPTIADGEARGEPDALGREDGQVLCEDLFPSIEVMDQREELGSLIFTAMHQQDPTEPEGTIIKREWLRRYDAPPEYQDLQQWSISVDCTFKDADTSDFVVIQCWARGPDGFYLIDQSRQRRSFTDTKRAIMDMWRTWPNVTKVLIEDKANGPAVLSEMQKMVPGMVAINPIGSKESRVHAITSMMESGHVWIPTRNLRPWSDDYINELCAFPNGVHDDQVDATSQYLNNLREGPLGMRKGRYPWSTAKR